MLAQDKVTGAAVKEKNVYKKRLSKKMFEFNSVLESGLRKRPQKTASRVMDRKPRSKFQMRIIDDSYLILCSWAMYS